ncbi:glycosyl hydrolase [Pseudactinotalea sp. HY158]|uniref:glycosyl hydrolase n=1 Tax=Pseudactinotalea sp. HY158 TaxID=2654547 RepID=UPI0018920E76|nr:glycosyl hydrolase [Pseudactinotalea sp. HY158]
MHELYDEIEAEYRPDVRWWLAEGLNTDETLRKNVQEIADSGFGAAEILAMPDEGADSSIYGWGSDEWNSDQRLVVEETTKHGLGFSLTSGTHWATANLPDTYTWDGATFDLDNKAASQELDYGTILLDPGETFDGTLPKPPLTEDAADAHTFTLEAVVAARLTEARPESGQDYDFDEGTEPGTLAFESLTDITDEVADGEPASITWTAPDDGQYALFAYWMHGSGQTAEPSVATNYTINYIDRYGVDAMKDYWEEYLFTPDLLEQIQQNDRGEIYMDSLETESFATAGLLWGYHFREEFQQRRGYDVTPYLPVVTWDRGRHNSDVPVMYDYNPATTEYSDTVQKIRNDLNQTFSELYEENVLKPLQSWLHEKGMTLRAEPSYGMQFEISTPAKYLDGVETETFAQNGDLDVYRGMLGSANMYGLPFSSETGAVGGHNYYYNMDHWTQISYLQFAGGVNRTVFHGYSGIEGSESATQWPGHEGMYSIFSDRFNSRQPAAQFYPEWTEMLGRNQKVLRQGQPQRDIAILRTDNRFISYGQPRDYTPPENSYFMNDKPYFWKDLSLQHEGYTYDYFSPQLLEDVENVSWSSTELQPDGPGYQAVILYQDSLELSSAERLLEIAEDGLPILFVNNTSEIRTHQGPEISYDEAASTTRFLNDDFSELTNIVKQIKALPNVRVVDNQSATMAALSDLGIEPRVEYGAPTDKLMTISRFDPDENVLYTFAYSFKFKKDAGDPATAFDLSMDGLGKPYTIDDWTGDISAMPTFEHSAGRTEVEITLKPGEAELIAVDLDNPDATATVRSSDASRVQELDGSPYVLAEESGTYTTVLGDGSVVETPVSVPDTISLDKWDISIEDWNEGEQVINTEEKFGHTTREAYFTTKKTVLEFPDSDLKPWLELPASEEQLSTLSGEDPAMSDVSGVGTYQTSFELPENWSEENGATLQLSSTSGGSAEVVVNGTRVEGLDLRTLRVDISDAAVPGTNDVEITVASTLTNRLLTRGYRTAGPAQAYGLVGDVDVIPYTLVRLESDEPGGESNSDADTDSETGGSSDTGTDSASDSDSTGGSESGATDGSGGAAGQGSGSGSPDLGGALPDTGIQDGMPLVVTAMMALILGAAVVISRSRRSRSLLDAED